MGFSFISRNGDYNVLVESVSVGFQRYIRKQFRTFKETKIFLIFYVAKFMDRVTDALDEIKKEKKKKARDNTRKEQASSIKCLFMFLRSLL